MLNGKQIQLFEKRREVYIRNFSNSCLKMKLIINWFVGFLSKVFFYLNVVRKKVFLTLIKTFGSLEKLL